MQSISYPATTPATGPDLIIGSETFTYTDGPAALRSGGEHWDFRNTYGPAYTGDPSAWSHSLVRR